VNISWVGVDWKAKPDVPAISQVCERCGHEPRDILAACNDVHDELKNRQLSDGWWPSIAEEPL
jgi:hypothetical protein